MRIAKRLLTIALLGCSLGAAAQDGAELGAQFAAYLKRATDNGSWPVVVAGHVSQASSSTAVFTAAADAGSDSRFALGNSASIYAGLLLADLASSGRLRLDDPISRYLPADFRCADARVCAITLQQLAAQDSGLPPLPANLFPRNPQQPWREFGEAELLDFLVNYRLPAEPPSRESALGLVLLGWILSNVESEDYTSVLSRRIATPLGLAATGNDNAGLLPGHRDGVELLPASAAGLGASLALRSNVGDQLKLLQAMLRPVDSPLRAALLLSRQPRNARSSFGLGWRINIAREENEEWPVVWQAASGNGYASFVGFRTDRQQAIVLLANADTSLMPLGLSILGATSPQRPPQVEVALANPGEFAGLYEFSPGVQLLIRDNTGVLSAQPSGRLAARMKPLGDDLFELAGSTVQLSFQRDALGRIETLRWAENGIIVPVRRLSARAPQLARAAVDMPPQTLSAFCGDYVVDEDVLARFHCNPRPALQFSAGALRELNAYAADRFVSDDSEFEVIAERSSAGDIQALRLVMLGSETRLPRTQWRQAPADAQQWLQRQRAENAAARVAAARQAEERKEIPATAAPVDPSDIPWLRELPAPVAAAAVVPADVESASAKPASDRRTPPQEPLSTRRGELPAKANPVKSATPAKVETLPEREPRHRFVPERSEDKKQ